MSSLFLQAVFLSLHVEVSLLMDLKKKKKTTTTTTKQKPKKKKTAEIPTGMLLASLCLVCELEVLRNDAGSSQLLFPHSVSLLTWGVFSVIPV